MVGVVTGDGGKEAVGGAGRSNAEISMASLADDKQRGSSDDCGNNRVVV